VRVPEGARHPARAGVVGRHDHELARRGRELDEGRVEGVVRAVVVEVVGVDVGDERDRRVVEQERAVRLVGLDDEEVVRPAPRAHAEGLDDAAVDEARVVARRQQGRDDHARRRRLAVGARHRDEPVLADQPGEGL
jgi:hypothetical protein